jgi:hypothetical protein
MIFWLRSHFWWSLVVFISALAVLFILLDFFKIGVFVFSVAALILAIVRAFGTEDKLLHIRGKHADIATYLAFALSLSLLAILLPTG